MELFKDLWAQTLSLPHHQLEICLAKPRKKASLPQFMLVSQFRLVGLCCGLVRIVIVTGTSILYCAGKVPRMRGAADGPGSQSYAGNINPFSYSARLEAIFLPPVKRFNHDISHDTSFSLILISFKLFTYDIRNKNFNINEYLNIFV